MSADALESEGAVADVDEVPSGEPARRVSERPDVNVGRRERVASALLGGTLVVRGLRRRSIGGLASVAAGGALLARGLTGRSRTYEAMGVDTVSGSGWTESGAPPDAATVERTVTVGRPADELVEYWQDPSHLSDLFGPRVRVTPVGEDRLEWRLEAPFGRTLSWETSAVEGDAEEGIQWESAAGSSVPSEATVRFREADADRGTEVTLRLRVSPPGGRLGDALAERAGVVPETVAYKALRRFKSLAETGEIPTLRGNVSARGRGDLL